MKKKLFALMMCLALALAFCVSCGSSSQEAEPEAEPETEATEAAPVEQRTVYVTPDWVKSVIDGSQEGYENYVLAEVAYPTDPSDGYNEGHLPGATYVSIQEVEDATGSEEGAYNLLAADAVRDYLLGHGITKDTKVILYGDDISGTARQAYLLEGL